MNSLLQEPPLSETDVSSAQWLRSISAAVRVSFVWFGVRKTLTPEQKSQAAESFGAEGDFLSARKKLLDTRHPVFKEVTAVKGKVQAYWRAQTLPYPEPGIRLLRQCLVEDFQTRMQTLRGELAQAVTKLDRHYEELKRTARTRLGELYNAADYPLSLNGMFGLHWDFPSVEPPEYLLQLNPDIYEEEKNRVAARFQEAVGLAEQAFLGEFSKLVSHLTERLSSGVDGQKKVFRDTAVKNLVEFFGRSRDLSIHSDGQLDQLVGQAQRIVRGIAPQELRDNGGLRQQIVTQFAGVQAALDGMLVDRPRRSILRNKPAEEGF